MKNTKYKQLNPKCHNGNRLVHRVVMEQHIGRKLTKEEIVHHINHDKSDNRLENLQLLANRREHNLLHRTNFCPHGHEFTPENTGIKYNINKNKNIKLPHRRCKECHRQTGNL